MKIILAVDPFEEAYKLSPPNYEDFNYWGVQSKQDILPVYVTDMADALLDSRATELPEAFANFAPLKIIKSKGPGRIKEVETLLQYSEQQGAGAIALLGHGKLTIKKLFGSFAEALLMMATKPILFLSEQSHQRRLDNKVLFATDFSAESFAAYRLLLQQLRDLKPELLVFNAIPLPNLAMAGPVYAQALNLLPQSYWQEQEEQAFEQGQKYIEYATAEGFSCRLVIANQVISIDQSLREVLERENVRMAAMVTVSSSLQRIFAGSVSRSILNRRAQVVWLCGPLGYNL